MIGLYKIIIQVHQIILRPRLSLPFIKPATDGCELSVGDLPYICTAWVCCAKRANIGPNFNLPTDRLSDALIYCWMPFPTVK